jgi:glycosyltransferase involved in cell wall biosynthesis
VDVDVVIPVYNGAAYLGQAIASALQQSVPPRRVIVVDDGSTDDSARIAHSFAGGPVELLVVSKANGGLSSARNAGLARCGSAFVALLDADDVWLPHKLARQLACFRQSPLPDLGLVYCDYDDIDAEGRPLVGFPSTRLQRGLRGRVQRSLYRGNLVAGSGSAVLIRRTLLERVGGFDESLPSSEDWELWLRLARHCAFDYVDEVLVHLRRHGSSMQAQKVRQILVTDLSVMARQPDRLGDRALVFAAAIRRLAQTPGALVRDLYESDATPEQALLERVSLGLPRPLFRSIVFSARVARVLRAQVRSWR